MSKASRSLSRKKYKHKPENRSKKTSNKQIDYANASRSRKEYVHSFAFLTRSRQKQPAATVNFVHVSCSSVTYPHLSRCKPSASSSFGPAVRVAIIIVITEATFAGRLRQRHRRAEALRYHVGLTSVSVAEWTNNIRELRVHIWCLIAHRCCVEKLARRVHDERRMVLIHWLLTAWWPWKLLSRCHQMWTGVGCRVLIHVEPIGRSDCSSVGAIVHVVGHWHHCGRAGTGYRS